MHTTLNVHKCSNFHIHILTTRVIVLPAMNNNNKKNHYNYNCINYICRKPKLYAQNELKIQNNEPNLGYTTIYIFLKFKKVVFTVYSIFTELYTIQSKNIKYY